MIIKPMEWGEWTLVKLVAPVALSVSKVTPKLTRFLAEKNNQLLLGKFSLDTKDDTNAVCVNMCYSATPWPLRNCPSQ